MYLSAYNNELVQKTKLSSAPSRQRGCEFRALAICQSCRENKSNRASAFADFASLDFTQTSLLVSSDFGVDMRDR